MNAAQLPLMAGVLAVLALGVLGAAPGVAMAPGAAAPAPSCPLHVSLSMPAQIGAGTPFVVLAAASTHSGCHLSVSSYMFVGLPGSHGAVMSTTGVVLAVAPSMGVYEIAVIASTNLGTLGMTGQIQVV